MACSQGLGLDSVQKRWAENIQCTAYILGHSNDTEKQRKQKWTWGQNQSDDRKWPENIGNVQAQTKTKVTTENWPRNTGNMQAHTKTKTMTENWPKNKGNVQPLTKTKTTTEIGLKTHETCRPKQKLKWQQKTGPKAGETCRPKQKPKWRQKTGLKTGNVQAQTKTKAMTEKRPQNRKHANIYTCRFYLVDLPIFL